MRNIEVDQQTQPPIAQLQVANELREMDGRDGLQRLDLDNNRILNQHIDPKPNVRKLHTFVHDRNRNFRTHIHAGLTQFMHKASGVRAFKQACPEGRMHPVRCLQDPL